MRNASKSSVGNKVVAVLFCGWIVSYIDRTIMNLSIAQIGTDLALDPAVQGIILSSFFVGYTLMQIPGGFLADRFGSRKVVTVALLFWSVFTGLTGLATALGTMLVFRVLFGIGEGSFPSASTKAIADYFPPNKRTQAQATMMSSNAVGLVVAPLIIAPLLVALGWRMAFGAVSILGIIIVALYLFVTRKRTGETSESSQGNATNKSLWKESKGYYKELLKSSVLWKTVLIFFCINTTNWGLISWMPTFLMTTKGVDLANVGFLTSIPACFMAVGMVLSGKIIASIGDKSKYGVIIALIGMAISLFLMANAEDVITVIVYQCIIYTLVSFALSFVFTVPHRLMRQEVVGTAFGIVNTGGQAAGIFSPLIIGALVAATGGSYTTAFVVLAGAAVVGLIVALTLPMKPKTDETPTN